MIVVRVELWSAITGEKTELGRMHICNVGGTQTRADYAGQTFVGRDSDALDRAKVSKHGAVKNHDRQGLHVWNLVRKMLHEMGYVK